MEYTLEIFFNSIVITATAELLRTLVSIKNEEKEVKFDLLNNTTGLNIGTVQDSSNLKIGAMIVQH